MPIARTEILSPVFPIYRFGHEDEVIERANDTEYGLRPMFIHGTSDKHSVCPEISRRAW